MWHLKFVDNNKKNCNLTLLEMSSKLPKYDENFTFLTVDKKEKYLKYLGNFEYCSGIKLFKTTLKNWAYSK